MPLSSLGWFNLVALAACFAATYPYRDRLAERAVSARSENPLVNAMSWRYRPESAGPAELASVAADVLVMDVVKPDGSFVTRRDVAGIRSGPSGVPRVVFAYLPVASADAGSADWDTAWSEVSGDQRPLWLDEEVCARAGEHRVRYWHEGWKTITFGSPDSRLGRIIAAGFDGVYLDGVDMYRSFETERPTARDDMIDFVVALSAEARRIKPGFLVVPQNSADLLSDAAFRSVIDGAGEYDLLGSATDREDGDDRLTLGRRAMARLAPLQREGKPIFVIEHLTAPESVEDAGDVLARRGLIADFEVPAFNAGTITAALPQRDGPAAWLPAACTRR